MKSYFLSLKRLPFLVGLLMLGLFTGCDSSDLGGDARLQVLLTDAPGDVNRAVVTIESVYLQADADTTEDGGRIVLSSTPVTVDLLTLQNEVLSLVDGAVVPEGTYGQLRLVISGGLIDVDGDDGTPMIYASSDAYAAALGETATGQLQMPSFAQSGLKVNLPASTSRLDGDQHIVLLDFDVAESFGKAAGNSGKWVMRPVIRATDFAVTATAHVELALADGVALPDTLTLGDFAATLDKGGDQLTVPFTQADAAAPFSATFRFLAPGTYPVALAVPEGYTVTTNATLLADVTLTSGGTVQQRIVLTDVAAN